MHVTHTHRNRQRLILSYAGFAIVILGMILFVVGTISVFGNIGERIFNAFRLLLWAIYITSFGVLFTLIFGRIGWHDNVLLDILLNQMSIIFVVVGISIVLVTNIFFNNQNNGAVTGIKIVILGFILALLGIWFRKDPPE